MLRKLLAVALLLALVLPLLFSALLLFSISGWVFTRSFYREFAEEEKLYAAILAGARAAKDHAWDVGDWVPPPGFENLPPEALAKALAQTVSAGYLREQAVRSVDAFFDALEGGQAELELDLRPLRHDLETGSRQRFADALAEALPNCRTGQDPLDPRSGLPVCRPSGMSIQRASQLIYAALPAALERVPDRYSSRGLPELASWVGPLGSVRLVWAAVVLALIAAGFWIGTAFLGGRNRAEVTAFLGWSLLPPSLLTLGCGLAVRFVFLGRWLLPLRYGFLGADAWASHELASALADALRAPLQTVSRGFLITGALALGLSLSLIAWWRTIRPEP
jgi:hypothetical protein